MGIGGLGGVFSAELIRAGYTPTLVTHNATITDAINTHGLTLHTPQQDGIRVPATAVTGVDDLPPDARFNAVWLVTKTTTVLDAVRAAQPLLTPLGYMVAFQNGMVEEAIVDVMGTSERLITASVAFGGTMEAPAVYRRTTDGRIFVGELDGTHSARVTTTRDALNHVVPTQVSTNINGLLWGKLCWNAAVSGLGAVAGYTFGEMTATVTGRDLLIDLYTEVKYPMPKGRGLQLGASAHRVWVID
jgi:2-dehydropantoate 2-reductase